MVHVAAADAPTANHVRSALSAAGLRAVVLGQRDSVPAEVRALLLVPGGSLASHRIAEARAVSERGGLVFCWSTEASATTAGDDWIALQILAQHGALVFSRLPALALAARLWFTMGEPREPAPRAVRLHGRSSGLKNRLQEALARVGVPLARTRAAGVLDLVVGDDGTVTIAASGGRPAPAGGLDEISSALALLRCGVEAPTKPVAIPPVDMDVIGQIVRPPARLLSEVASKRLLFAAGIRAPAERLCGSASDAARFAAELDGPVVLKLVRPGLERKKEAGAVITAVSGAATVRRAYHDLARLGGELGPPRPLGVLVAATVEGGCRLWCTTRRHPDFGLVLTLGRGDAPAPVPERAVSFPLGPGHARRVLAGLLPDADEAALAAFDEAVSRLGALLEAAGDMLERIEVHPLVVPPDGGEAVALDAVAEVSEPGPQPEKAS